VIDAVEALIALALTDPGLQEQVGDRIALRQKFGKEPGDWPVASKALTLRWDGGEPDLYIEVQKPRVEVRCYGQTFYEAGQVYRALVAWTRALDRRAVQTSQGQALVFFVLMSSAPSMFVDPDTSGEVMLAFLECSVAEPAID
jgi:hypothetical protein